MILTNNHVVKDSRDVSVTLENKKSYKAQVLGVDPRNDIALLQIHAPEKLPFLRLGNSDALQVGQKVLAIGNPFALSGTLTTGVVSSMGRTLANGEEGELRNLIQTDAAINPGNSGGPLLDSHGDVIGINTAIYGQGGEGGSGNIGIGFAMPINRAKADLEDFKSTGHVAPSDPGVSTVLIQGDLALELQLPQSGGLLVQEVQGDSPAARAGVRGDTPWASAAI
jgi:S1-C subfamily serine protease